MTVFLTRQARLECPAAPAPGIRAALSTHGYGGLRDVGSAGCIWSSTIMGNSAPCLDFHCGGVYPQNNSYRAYGFPLRCLQE